MLQFHATSNKSLGKRDNIYRTWETYFILKSDLRERLYTSQSKAVLAVRSMNANRETVNMTILITIVEVHSSLGFSIFGLAQTKIILVKIKLIWSDALRHNLIDLGNRNALITSMFLHLIRSYTWTFSFSLIMKLILKV